LSVHGESVQDESVTIKEPFIVTTFRSWYEVEGERNLLSLDGRGHRRG
jgi:hypothetical protein